MEKKVRSLKEIRQRRFLLILPLLMLPFTTLIFWTLGGGKAERPEAQTTVKKGFNINLPGANLNNDKAMDKMSYYNQARTDSIKFLELIKNDPHYRHATDTDDDAYPLDEDGIFSSSSAKSDLPATLTGGGYNDAHTEEIYRKLAELDREINNPPSPSIETESAGYSSASGMNRTGSGLNAPDIAKLEQMMERMNQPNGEDPEMRQISELLDKILDAQHPARVQERLKDTYKENEASVLRVSAKTENVNISYLDTGNVPGNSGIGFYSLSETSSATALQNAIPAVIHESQTLVDGAVVKLRLTGDMYISGTPVPKDNFLYGTASLRGERLQISINSIRFNNALFPVQLSVYDMDGLEGIYIPGAITRDVARQSADRSVQTIGMPLIDPSLGVQAASAGMEAAKSLISKKVKLIKVSVKAGYRVLLYDGAQKHGNPYSNQN